VSEIPEVDTMPGTKIVENVLQPAVKGELALNTNVEE